MSPHTPRCPLLAVAGFPTTVSLCPHQRTREAARRLLPSVALPAAPERHTLALCARPTFYCELFRSYRSPRFPSAHPRSGPLGAPFGRLACGARATHARASRSPYFHYRIISLIGEKNARGSAPAKICILQYPYRNPTSERRGPPLRARELALKRPRRWRASHPLSIR